MTKNFAITGVAGYIAPRHLKAIRDTGNNLVAALDPHDSVGILDSFFSEVSFFTEFERFDRHLERLRRSSEKEQVKYLSICSPNYLHDAHIRFALRVGANAICEKPLVLNPWNCEALTELESESQGNIYTVLQLRLHPAIIALKKKYQNKQTSKKTEIDLTYITSRGCWYQYSWKGRAEQSGGLATNIGIHFFDMLIWIFGSVQQVEVQYSDQQRISGILELEQAQVRWFLSLNKADLPAQAQMAKKTTYRSLQINAEEIEFSSGFTDLHTRVYEKILAGNGFGIAEAKPSIDLVHKIRNTEITAANANSHPILKKRKR